MHNLILNKIKLNDNIDDHFEDLQKRHHNIFDDSEITKDKGFYDINNEKSLENRNRDLDKKLVTLYRLHNSKFHQKRENKLKDVNLNLLLNLNQKSDIKKIGTTSNNFIIKLRQKMAFKYRFMNESKNKSISPERKKILKFKKQDEKMIKILKISKSIPDVLYNQIKEMKSEKNNINYNENIQKINASEIKNSFKLSRYSGNIYDYYKSDIPFYLKRNFFGKDSIVNIDTNKKNKLYNFKTEDKYMSNFIKKSKIYKIKTKANKSENSNKNYKKIITKKVITEHKKSSGYINLSSLLS